MSNAATSEAQVALTQSVHDALSVDAHDGTTLGIASVLTPPLLAVLLPQPAMARLVVATGTRTEIASIVEAPW